MITVLGEIADPEATLGELRRVLKPSGRVVVGEILVDPDFTTLRGSSKMPAPQDYYSSVGPAPRSATSPGSAWRRTRRNDGAARSRPRSPLAIARDEESDSPRSDRQACSLEDPCVVTKQIHLSDLATTHGPGTRSTAWHGQRAFQSCVPPAVRETKSSRSCDVETRRGEAPL